MEYENHKGRVEVFSRPGMTSVLALDFGDVSVVIEQSTNFFAAVIYRGDEQHNFFLDLFSQDFWGPSCVELTDANFGDFLEMLRCIDQDTLHAKAILFSLLAKHFSSKLATVVG